MSDENVLRAKAREAISNGRLPSRRPDRTWGGPGVGMVRKVCGEAVTKDQLENQVELSRDDEVEELIRKHQETMSRLHAEVAEMRRTIEQAQQFRAASQRLRSRMTP